MKGSFFKKLLFLAALAGLSAGFASAAPAQQVSLPHAAGCNQQGTSGGVWGVMQHQSTVMQARDKGFSGVVKENDSSLAATCFDKAMALSSRLGTIFSDKPAANILPPKPNLMNQYPNAPGLKIDPALKNVVYNIYAGIGMMPDPTNPGKPAPASLGVTMGGALSNILDNYLGGSGKTKFPGNSCAPVVQNTTDAQGGSTLGSPSAPAVACPTTAPATPVVQATGMARDATNPGVDVFDGNGQNPTPSTATSIVSTAINTPTVNFGGSIGSAMGSTGTVALTGMVNSAATALNNFAPTLTGIYDATNGTLNKLVDPVNGTLTKMQNVLGEIGSFGTLISGALNSSGVGPLSMLAPYTDLSGVAQATSMVGQIYGGIKDTMAVQNQMFTQVFSALYGPGGFVSTFTDMTNGAVGAADTSMSGQSAADASGGTATPPAGSGCNYMSSTWAGKTAATDAAAGTTDDDDTAPDDADANDTPDDVDGLIDSPPAPGMNYGSYTDITTNGGPPGSSMELQGAINNGDNATAFAQAQTENTRYLRAPLQPGDPKGTGITSWKPVPTQQQMLQLQASDPNYAVTGVVSPDTIIKSLMN